MVIINKAKLKIPYQPKGNFVLGYLIKNKWMEFKCTEYYTAHHVPVSHKHKYDDAQPFCIYIKIYVKFTHELIYEITLTHYLVYDNTMS